MRVALLISGGGSNMVRLVESMRAPGHPATPVLVISNRPEAAGLEKAAALGVPTAVVDHTAYPDRVAFEADLAAALDHVPHDLVCLAGFMRILTPDFVAGRDILNIHPSLLPKYPGLNTHQRAIDAGDAEGGVTVHRVTGELDAGPVLGQARVPILPGDSATALADRVLAVEHRLYPMVLERLARGVTDRIDLPPPVVGSTSDIPEMPNGTP